MEEVQEEGEERAGAWKFCKGGSGRNKATILNILNQERTEGRRKVRELFKQRRR